MDKPFALFGGDRFYPGGGMADFAGTFATVDEAVEAGKMPLGRDEKTKELLPAANGTFDPFEWYHVVDLRTMQVVAEHD